MFPLRDVHCWLPVLFSYTLGPWVTGIQPTDIPANAPLPQRFHTGTVCPATYFCTGLTALFQFTGQGGSREEVGSGPGSQARIPCWIRNLFPVLICFHEAMQACASNWKGAGSSCPKKLLEQGEKFPLSSRRHPAAKSPLRDAPCWDLGRNGLLV